VQEAGVNSLLITSILMFGLVCDLALAQSYDPDRLPPAPSDAPLPELISQQASAIPADSLAPPSAALMTPSWQITPAPNASSFGSPVGSVQPGLYVRGDTMFLRLSHTTDQPLADGWVNLTPNGPPSIMPIGAVMTTSQLGDTSFQPVPRGTLGCRLDNGTAFEVTYFSRNDWAESASGVSSPSFALIPLVSTGSHSIFVADRVSSSLTTALYNAEVNVFQPFQHQANIEWLVGLRYFRMVERFGFHAEADGTHSLYQSDYDVRSSNNLYGLQLGLRWTHNWNRWSLTGLTKTGIYGNDASQQQFLGNNSHGVIRDFATSRVGVAVIQEVGINAVYHLTERCLIRGGYNAFLIGGLARAGDQLDFSANPAPTLYSHGSALLHGPSAGVELQF
jgi:hypothetical protein